MWSRQSIRNGELCQTDLFWSGDCNDIINVCFQVVTFSFPTPWLIELSTPWPFKLCRVAVAKYAGKIHESAPVSNIAMVAANDLVLSIGLITTMGT